MRYLVTGAAGFIGSTLCDLLLACDHEVVGLDAFSTYYERTTKENNLLSARDHHRFKLVEADLATVGLNSLLEGTDVVFHLAAQPGVRTSWGGDFATYVHHNLIATQALLEACRVRRPRRVIYASSSSIYGEANVSPVSEDAAPYPISPYGMTKLGAEHLCNVYARVFGLPIVTLRYFTVFGPRQRPDMAFHRFIRSALMGAPITVYGDGSQTRDFTYVDDAVSATVAAATAGPDGATYNIGGGATLAIRAVLKVIESVAGIPLTVTHEDASPGDVRDTSADTQRARDALGFIPTTSVEVGIGNEMEWLKRSVIADDSQALRG